MILRECFLGVRRFDVFEDRIGLSRYVLSMRLKSLVGHGVLDKVEYGHSGRRFEYRLTEKGRDLYPIFVTMMAWGDKWAAPDGPPLRLRHQTCGHISTYHLVCDSCQSPIDARDMLPELGDTFAEQHKKMGATAFAEAFPYYRSMSLKHKN